MGFDARAQRWVCDNCRNRIEAGYGIGADARHGIQWAGQLWCLPCFREVHVIAIEAHEMGGVMADDKADKAMSFDGDLLRRLRMGAGLTQAELGQRVGVSAAAVSAWESSVCCPRPKRMPSLARSLGVEPLELLREA